MSIRAIKLWIISLGWLPLILFQGCTTSGFNQGAAETEVQTARNERLIVVPVFILAPPQNGYPGSGGNVLPNPSSPDQTIRTSGLLPLGM